ncbi:hypothetical protein QFC21_005025 [Naganishia friedmannii]|uniref:Uncharacterized protein n=1 Tax=Naganishia friedmannii TaxID=89922 RepID=A0ACC2VCD7_9TREE|nr:hypothetical protein QFC21_005025 [Naganishia friedmannii]
MVPMDLETPNKMPPGAMTPPSTPSGHHRSQSSLSVPYPDSPSILSRPYETPNDLSLNTPPRPTNGRKQRHISFAANTSMGNTPPHGKSHYRIRRFLRMLKKSPWFLKLLFLFWTVGVIALTMNAVTELRTGTQSRPGWRDLQKKFAQSGYGDTLCDPTQGDGFVNQENVWERSDGACGSSHLLYRFSKTPKEKYPELFPEFANKTVFIYGDSVGRHLFDDYCRYLHMDMERRPFPNQNTTVIYWEAAVCTQPELNFKVTHLHAYGFANTSDPASMEIVRQAFPGGPWDFETRISRLFDEALPDLKLDLVQLNGGAWDFLWMYNRDVKFRQHHDVIPKEDIQTFQLRLKELIAFVRVRFPDAKPLWINPHWLNPIDLNVRHAWAGAYHHKAPLNASEDSPLLPPLFTPRRQTQHHHALSMAAEETGVDIVDYWKIKDSFASDEYFAGVDRVHPIETPRAVVVDMLLEKMHRWFAYGI